MIVNGESETIVVRTTYWQSKKDLSLRCKSKEVRNLASEEAKQTMNRELN